MDEMVNLLGAAAIAENAEKESSFEKLYKNRGRCGNQDERRRCILEIQKSDRNKELDRYRGILELVEAIEDNIFHSPATTWKPKTYVSGFTCKIPNYCDVLMMSEWMYGRPIDFEENWLMALCPKGTRMLVLSHQGTTKCFNKYGHFRFECRTALPGGNPCQSQAHKLTVVLDGFYSKDSNTMHVLDILAWNDCVMTDGEASFRDFWLRSQLSQIPELQKITKKNKMIFNIIPKLPCTTESLNKTLMTFPYYDNNIPPVDGLLFFHKDAHYIAGETPMVGWLYPYMVKEVLGEDIKVHPRYILERPTAYTGYMDFIETFEKSNSRKKQRKIFGPKVMETGKRIMQKEPADASTDGDITEEQNDTENMEADANTGENNNMEAVASDDATAESTNGNTEAGIPLNGGGGDGEFGPKKSETESMEAMVADLVQEKEVNQKCEGMALNVECE